MNGQPRSQAARQPRTVDAVTGNEFKRMADAVRGIRRTRGVVPAAVQLREAPGVNEDWIEDNGDGTGTLKQQLDTLPRRRIKWDVDFEGA